jgi:hypothetical protein
VWVYQFTAQQQQQTPAKLIAGKNINDARTILLSQKGVHDVTIQVQGGNVLPADNTAIKIAINQVAGLQPTGSSQGPSGAGTPTNAPGVPTPQPGNE